MTDDELSVMVKQVDELSESKQAARIAELEAALTEERVALGYSRQEADRLRAQLAAARSELRMVEAGCGVVEAQRDQFHRELAAAQERTTYYRMKIYADIFKRLKDDGEFDDDAFRIADEAMSVIDAAAQPSPRRLAAAQGSV